MKRCGLTQKKKNGDIFVNMQITIVLTSLSTFLKLEDMEEVNSINKYYYIFEVLNQYTY